MTDRPRTRGPPGTNRVTLTPPSPKLRAAAPLSQSAPFLLANRTPLDRDVLNAARGGGVAVSRPQREDTSPRFPLVIDYTGRACCVLCKGWNGYLLRGTLRLGWHLKMMHGNDAYFKFVRAKWRTKRGRPSRSEMPALSPKWRWGDGSVESYTRIRLTAVQGVWRWSDGSQEVYHRITLPKHPSTTARRAFPPGSFSMDATQG